MMKAKKQCVKLRKGKAGHTSKVTCQSHTWTMCRTP